MQIDNHYGVLTLPQLKLTTVPRFMLQILPCYNLENWLSLKIPMRPRKFSISDFSLFFNDPLYRLLGKVNLLDREGRIKNIPTILLSILITWVPCAILAFFQGIAINKRPEYSFLYDYAAYAQFIFAVPFFIWAENYIDAEIQYGLKYFYSAGIINQQKDLIDLKNTLQKSMELQSSVIAGLATFIIAYVINLMYVSGELTNHIQNWHTFTVGSREYLTWAGWWNSAVSIPIMVYWHIRWIWKISIWYWILWRLSKAKLQLHANHPDQFGGLGFLARLQSRFAILILGIGLLIAATVGYKFNIEHSPIATIAVAGVVVAYVLLAPLVFIAPLFYFRSQLSQAKKNDMLSYSALAASLTQKIEDMLLKSTQKTVR